MIQFKRLRINGFKSFVDRTELDIGPGLNGVVGPNGCGKSNLVEALRWVMGENSARRMRGDGMEDVIFNGTSKRSARNIADVSLLLDNSSRVAPAAYNGADEIEVVRRIERDRGSNYKINGKNVRARDVQMLFADTVTGANSPAMVSQGRIDLVELCQAEHIGAVNYECIGAWNVDAAFNDISSKQDFVAAFVKSAHTIDQYPSESMKTSVHQP